MTVKSVIQIDVNDKNFQNFLKTYNQYKASLQSMPSAWKKINQLTNGTAISFRGLVAEQVAATVKQKLLLQAQERAAQITKTTADRWKEMATSARSVASHVTETTRQLLRWASLGGIIGGLVGAGSLWGLDRIGGNVASGRRQSLGLGLSYGQRRAFELNYGRVVDPNSVLGGVNEALGDVTKRYTLYGAGLSERDIAGKNTGEVSALLITKLKQLADQTPQAQLGNVIAARGLGQFVTLQDLERLKNTPGSELAGINRSYGGDIRSLSLTDDVQRKWQDFVVQISKAGEQIETVFQKKLVALVPGLTELSESVVRVVESLNSEQFNGWLKDVGKGIESFAQYLGGDDFQAAVKTFVEDFDAVAGVVRKVASWLPKTPTGGVGTFDPHLIPGGRADRVRNEVANAWKYLSGGNNAERHNPGGLRRPGASTGFASFESDDAGVAAIAKQLLIYQDRDKLSTISEIINKYAPGNENDTGAYIKDVSGTTGYGANQKLNLHDRSVLAGLTSAITKHEGVRYYPPGAARVVIEDNTGGNVNISTSKLVRSP